MRADSASRRRSYALWALFSIALAAAICGPQLMMASDSMKFGSWTPGQMTRVELLSVLAWVCYALWIIAVVALPVAAFVSIFFTPKRRYALMTAAAWGLCIAQLFVPRITPDRRVDSLEQVALRAGPIVQAIAAYHAAQGAYPPNLLALTPDYLAEIPSTGITAFPKYDYRLAQKGAPFQFYELFVLADTGFMRLDRFVYWPEDNYPDQVQGYFSERVGDWAYLRD